MNDLDTAREFLRQLGSDDSVPYPILTLGTLALAYQNVAKDFLASPPTSQATDLHSTLPLSPGGGALPSQRGTPPVEASGSDSIRRASGAAHVDPPRCDSSTCWDEMPAWAQDDGLSPAHSQQISALKLLVASVLICVGCFLLGYWLLRPFFT